MQFRVASCAASKITRTFHLAAAPSRVAKRCGTAARHMNPFTAGRVNLHTNLEHIQHTRITRVGVTTSYNKATTRFISWPCSKARACSLSAAPAAATAIAAPAAVAATTRNAGALGCILFRFLCFSTLWAPGRQRIRTQQQPRRALQTSLGRCTRALGNTLDRRR